MSAGPRRGAAVLGSPIAHSLSPALHNAAYAALGLDGWSYRAVECDGSALADVLRALDDEGLAGVSLTMPLKRDVLPLLARVERLAADVGAVNTVLFGGVAGEWWGANTDVPGMVAALRAAGVTAPRSATVLGGGATAASTLAALAELGARHVEAVVRRRAAGEELARIAQVFGVDLAVHDWGSDALSGRTGTDLVVSTLPGGAADELAQRLPNGGLAALFDVVYDPWPTPLAAAWQAAGGQVIGGLQLLIEQAAEQVRLMTGQEPPLTAMRAAVEST